MVLQARERQNTLTPGSCHHNRKKAPKRLHGSLGGKWAIRSGQDGVPIHRLRHLLNWQTDRFDTVLEQLRVTSHVALDIGDPSHGSDDERHHSYEVNGQVYLSLF